MRGGGHINARSRETNAKDKRGNRETGNQSEDEDMEVRGEEGKGTCHAKPTVISQSHMRRHIGMASSSRGQQPKEQKPKKEEKTCLMEIGSGTVPNKLQG